MKRYDFFYYIINNDNFSKNIYIIQQKAQNIPKKEKISYVKNYMEKKSFLENMDSKLEDAITNFFAFEEYDDY